MPTPADLVFLLLILIGYPLWDYFVAWPKARAKLASGDPHARRVLYRGAIRTQWIAAGLVGALWILNARDRTQLWLQMPTGWRLVVGAVVAVLAFALMAAQAIGATRANAETRAAIRPRLSYAAPILPRTLAERRWFMVLSITAGTCEELVYRGYVVWVLTPWLGVWGAAATSVIAFGVAHSYLGRQGVLRATVAGAVFAWAVVGLRSLYPGMILHALLDMGAGAVGYALLHDEASSVPSVPPEIAPAG